MRQTLLVGGLLSVSASMVAAIVAQGCAAGTAGEAQSFLEDGGGAGVEGGGPPVVVDGSGLNTIDSATGPTLDANGLQTCVHNTDCTSPNLCVGDNGVECAGGFCVPTGQPMNCDDGIACTTDSCDANTNACVHTPNDSACPNGEYCDPTQNCVQELPCTPGDSVCDRLNVSPCAGLWSCDSTKMYCVEGIAPCPSIPNAVTACNGSLADGGVPPVIDGGPVTLDSGTEAIDAGPIACSWTCLPGFDHRVWTGSSWEEVFEIASPPDTAGCECQFTETADGGIAYDPPDMGFVDSNCDGIDGTIASALFVDFTTGHDVAGAGAMNAPFKTINAALAAAPSANKTDVYVSKGIYSESVSLPNGISIYGGYDAANAWQRSTSNTTEIVGPANVGLTISGATLPTQVQLFTIYDTGASGTNTNGDGQSGIGVLVLNATGAITVRGCTIFAANGVNGTNSGGGSTGGSGASGQNASGTSLGGGGAGCVAGTNGGAGGASVSGVVNGNPGNPGFGISGGGQGAGGGGGGGMGACGTTSSGPGTTGAIPGNSGGTGGPGTNGAPAETSFGSFDANGNYLPPFGSNSGMGAAGNPGGGGGGGGAGGGSAGGTGSIPFDPPFCTDCTGIASGGGGGGGGGGCGGTPGYGGRGGGGSFGILSVGSSTVTVDSCTITTGTGGTGGSGGNGGPGGAGGGYGGGGGGNQDSDCGNQVAGPGAHGSAGGYGGQGGGGAGGAGGPSVCVASQGSAPSVTGTFGCTAGAGGLGGSGGSNGLANALSGPPGFSGPTYN